MESNYRVTKNVLYNFIAQATILLVGIFTSPFIIHRLGNDAYGVLSIVSVFIGYLAILDLGMGAAIIKYIAEYKAKEDKESLQQVINTSFSVFICLGLLGALMLFIFAGTVANTWLNIPQHLIPTTITVFYLSGIGFFINMILSVYNSIPSALQRMDLVSKRNIVFSLVNTLGMVGLLAWGFGLQTIVIWNLFISCLATFLFALIVKKLIPSISLKPEFDKTTFLKLFKFSGFKFISNISGIIVFQVDRLLIGIFHPIASVTFYSAPLSLIQKGQTMLANITTAVFPAITHAHSLDETERMQDLYIRMTKFTVVLMLPFSAFLFLFSYKILYLWLGLEFAQSSSSVLQVLAIAYFLASIAAPASVAAEATGHPKIPAVFASISALINLVAALILIPRFGIEGAAWALFINSALQVPAFLYIVNKNIVKIKNWVFLKDVYLKPLIVLPLASLPALYISSVFTSNIVSLGLGSLTFGLLFLGFNLALGTFDQRDRLVVNYLFAKAKSVIK